MVWWGQPFCWEPPSASICGSFLLGWSVALQKTTISRLGNINSAASALEGRYNQGAVSALPHQLPLMTLIPESLWSIPRRAHRLPSVRVRGPIIRLPGSEEGIRKSKCSLYRSSTPPSVFSLSLPSSLQSYLLLPVPSLSKALQPKVACSLIIPLL